MPHTGGELRIINFYPINPLAGKPWFWNNLIINATRCFGHFVLPRMLPKRQNSSRIIAKWRKKQNRWTNLYLAIYYNRCEAARQSRGAGNFRFAWWVPSLKWSGEIKLSRDKDSAVPAEDIRVEGWESEPARQSSTSSEVFRTFNIII